MTPFYERDGITIFCGDCLEVMPTLAPPVDAIIADLPYGTTACAWDSVIPFEPLWANYKRLIKRAGAVVLTASQPFTSALVMSNPAWFRYEWIWDKVGATGFLDVSFKPMKQHESVVIFYQEKPTYNPQLERGEAYIRPQGKKRPQVYRETLATSFTVNSGYRYPKSILQVSNASQASKFHPTQKPVALMSYLIRTYTNPGELILDNTAGSGTTGVAAQNEGRRCIMIEQDEDYCRIAVDRLRQPSFFSLPSKEPAPVTTQPPLW